MSTVQLESLQGARVFLLNESEAVIHEPTVTNGTDRVTTHELLLSQKRQIASRDEQEPHCL